MHLQSRGLFILLKTVRCSMPHPTKCDPIPISSRKKVQILNAIKKWQKLETNRVLYPLVHWQSGGAALGRRSCLPGHPSLPAIHYPAAFTQKTSAILILIISSCNTLQKICNTLPCCSHYPALTQKSCNTLPCCHPKQIVNFSTQNDPSWPKLALHDWPRKYAPSIPHSLQYTTLLLSPKKFAQF